MKKPTLSLVALLLGSVLVGTMLSKAALGAKPAPAKPSDQAKAYLNAPPEQIARWRQLKFGLFIHWGPVSLMGTEIGWSRGGPRRGTGGTGQIPLEVYDNLYKKFNPVKFDARQWVQIAKAAEMRYLVFTSRHHDGFTMFDSKVTDYKITSPESPYRKDVVQQLADACHQEGLAFGLYYSQPDWHHPDYRTPNHDRYLKYMHEQVRELLTNYGRVDILFFDGLGGSAADWDAERLFKMIRTLQPDIIINNRCGLPGDYDTPEQHIGKMQTDRPWETCMTIGNQWAWKPNDNIKSLKDCLQTLIKCAGGDGNLLFNVGPMPDGRIEPRQADRLKEMGDWLRQYGQSIFGTRGGPFRRAGWGAATSKDNTVYLHLLDPKLDPVVLPPIDKKIVSSRVLTGGSATVKQDAEGIEISVPAADRKEIDTIVVLTLDGPAAELKLGRLPTASVATGKRAAASNVYQGMLDHFGPQKALDDDPETRWATDAGTHQAWLEVDLGEPRTIDRAMISEAYAGRVQEFELQAKQDGSWKTFYRGKRMGEQCALAFEPLKAQLIRLNILQATEGPTIWEFQLFEAKK
ncbi:MAG: alpha-L-fucosidase [Thermoguttaceae bacterium]